MTPELIGKYVESKEVHGNPVNIFFRQRNAITGIFIETNDYQEMKAKNFWRIVTESKIEEWKKTKDANLAKLFSGSDFSRLK